MYRVILSPRARKQLGKLGEKDQKKIWDALHQLSKSPFMGKKLQGDMIGRYTLRVWPYRIIYTIDKKVVTVTVLAIGHRQGIYKKRKR